MKPEEVLSQLDKAIKSTNKITGRKKYRNIVFANIEKSALIQRVLSDIYPKIPILSTRYDSTTGITKDSLVVVVSYQGHTSEIITFFHTVLKKTKNILVVSSGRKLLSLAKKNRCKSVAVPKGLKSRSSFFLLFFATFFALEKLKIISVSKTSLDETIGLIKSFARNYKTFQFVHALKNAVPAIYTWDSYSCLGTIIKHDFNLMAKLHVIKSTLPEADYDDIEALWQGSSLVVPIFIIPPDEKAQHVFFAVEQIAKKKNMVLKYMILGTSKLAQIVSTILFFELVAERLAEARLVDPMSRDAVLYLKEQLHVRIPK